MARKPATPETPSADPEAPLVPTWFFDAVTGEGVCVDWPEGADAPDGFVDNPAKSENWQPA